MVYQHICLELIGYVFTSAWAIRNDSARCANTSSDSSSRREDPNDVTQEP